MSSLFRYLSLTGAHPRNRGFLILILLGVIVVGLFSRSDAASGMPRLFTVYGGDTLWTLAVYLTLVLVFHRAHPVMITLGALLISYTVEVSQLLDVEWLNALRDTLFGALVLGAGFLPSDFVCYSLGACMGLCGELIVARWQAHRSQMHLMEFPPGSAG